MITMVSILDRSARVVASPAELAPPEVATAVPALETPVSLAHPASMAPPPSATSSKPCAWRHFTSCASASSLKRPRRADGERVGVAIRGADPLVFSAECDPPRFGLHAHAVGELVIGFVLTRDYRGTIRIHRTRDQRYD